MKFNLIKEFKKDLNDSVANNLRQSTNTKHTILFLIAFGIFIFSKPYFMYYKGYLDRKRRIEILKKEEKWVL